MLAIVFGPVPSATTIDGINVVEGAAAANNGCPGVAPFLVVAIGDALADDTAETADAVVTADAAVTVDAVDVKDVVGVDVVGVPASTRAVFAESASFVDPTAATGAEGLGCSMASAAITWENRVEMATTQPNPMDPQARDRSSP